MMITMAGNFNDGTTPVKVQYGPVGGSWIRKQHGETSQRPFCPWSSEKICRYGNLIQEASYLPTP